MGKKVNTKAVTDYVIVSALVTKEVKKELKLLAINKNKRLMALAGEAIEDFVMREKDGLNEL